MAPEGYNVQAALHDGVRALQVPRRLRSRARSRVMSARRRAPDDVRCIEAEIRIFPGQDVRADVCLALAVRIQRHSHVPRVGPDSRDTTCATTEVPEAHGTCFSMSSTVAQLSVAACPEALVRGSLELLETTSRSSQHCEEHAP